MAAIDPSKYEEIVIESADRSKTVDISAGVIAFTYFAVSYTHLTLPTKRIV